MCSLLLKELILAWFEQLGLDFQYPAEYMCIGIYAFHYYDILDVASTLWKM